nr:MAG: structural polyprotein [Crogonang virus 4]
MFTTIASLNNNTFPHTKNSHTGGLSSIPENEQVLYEGIYTKCNTCSHVLKIADLSGCIIIHKHNCDLCLFEPQAGFFTTDTIFDVKSRIQTVKSWLYEGKHHGEAFTSHYISMSPSASRHLDLIEDVTLLGYQFIMSRGCLDRYVAIINFCKLRGARISPSTMILAAATDFLGAQVLGDTAYPFDEEVIRNRVAHDFRAEADPIHIDDGTDNIFAHARKYLGVYDKMKETAIYQKLRKFLFYILTLGMLDGINISYKTLKYTKWEEEALRRDHQPGFDMVHSMLDTLCFVCDRGIQYWKTNDPEIILHSGSAYEKWVIDANKLTRDAQFLGNPEAHGVNRFEFLSSVKNAIEQGESIVKFAGGIARSEKLYLMKVLNDLKMVEAAELTRRAAQEPRKDPFSILIHGSSNIAKSQLTQILFKHYGKIFGHPTGSEFMYTRCPTDAFWSMFNSTQWCIIMDDIAFLKPNGEPDPTLMEMLQVKNSVPYCPPQAALEDKGRTPLRAELVIGTTNTKSLNLHAYFACPFAIARRMSYILTAHVKPEFAKHNFMADSSKIPTTSEGEYMNIWNFDVSIPIPASDQERDNQGTRYTQIRQFDDINEMLVWFITVAKEHDVSQKKAKSAGEVMTEISVCGTCYKTQKLCTCNEVLVEHAESARLADRVAFGLDGFREEFMTFAASDDDEYVQYDSPEIPDRSVPHISSSEVIQSPRTPSASPTEETDQPTIRSYLNLDDFSTLTQIQLWFVSMIIKGNVNDIPFADTLSAKSHGWLLFPIIGIACYHWSFLIAILAVLAILSVYQYLWIILHFWARITMGDMWKFKLLRRFCTSTLDTWRVIFALVGDSVKQRHFTDKGLQSLKRVLVSAAFIAAITVAYKKFFPRTYSEKIRKCEKKIEKTGDKFSAAHKELKRVARAGQKVDLVEQGGVESNEILVGVTPQPKSLEKPTFYYHNAYKNTGMEISGASKCSQGDQLKQYMQMGLARLELKFDDTEGDWVSSTAFNIVGNLWLINKHSMKSNSGTMNIIFEDITQNVSRNLRGVRFCKGDIYRHPSKDFVIMEIRSLPPGKNLIKYFPVKDILQGSYNGVYLKVTRSGLRTELPVVDLRDQMCPVFKIPAYLGKVGAATKLGDCGSPLLADVGSSKVILGIHMCGNEINHVMVQHISQYDINGIIQNFVPQVECGIIPISAPDCVRVVEENLHEKSAFRFIPKGTATIGGSFKGYRPTHKSKVRKTYIRDYVVAHGYEDTFGAPDMSWKPWNLALTDMTSPNNIFDNDKLKMCAEAFLDDIMTGLGDKIKELEIYTTDVAVNGAPGVTFVDRMNLSTSAGNPYKKSKKHFISVDDDDFVTLDKVIVDRIGRIESCYSKGQRFHPQFCAHLKDEPTPLRKILAGKTRVFTGGEFAWSVVVRKVLLSHIRLIQNNPYIFEAMPGIAAQSTQWQELYEYIIAHGIDRIIAGDYEKFDKRMMAAFILMAFWILEKMAEKAGWPEEHLVHIRCIAYDTAFANMDFNGDCVEIPGNPSGHPLTVIINCFVNSLYMRYAFMLISGKNVTEFKKYVNLATYGDDNIMGVSAECPGFTHTRIAVAMKIIGVGYTMAEKEAESVPYIHIKDASFLKRKFVWDDDIGAISAPLDESSFHKMLTNTVMPDTLSLEAHSICVIETAIREYWFHGKDVFEERRNFFLRLVAEMQLDAWVRESTFPSYDQIKTDYWARSEAIAASRS